MKRSNSRKNVSLLYDEFSICSVRILNRGDDREGILEAGNNINLEIDLRYRRNSLLFNCSATKVYICGSWLILTIRLRISI